MKLNNGIVLRVKRAAKGDYIYTHPDGSQFRVWRGSDKMWRWDAYRGGKEWNPTSFYRKTGAEQSMKESFV